MTDEEFKATNAENYKTAALEMMPVKNKNNGRIVARQETHTTNMGSYSGYFFCFNGEHYFMKTREEVDAFMAANGYSVCDNRYQSVIYENPAIHSAYVKEKTERGKIETEVMAARKRLYEAALKHLFSNNNKIVYIRYGNIPESGCSYNHRDNCNEKGVSVYRAVKIGNNYYIDVSKNCFTYMGIKTRKCYIVAGELLDSVGSDEESLLKNVVVREQISNDSVKTVNDFITDIFAE